MGEERGGFVDISICISRLQREVEGSVGISYYFVVALLFVWLVAVVARDSVLCLLIVHLFCCWVGFMFVGEAGRTKRFEKEEVAEERREGEILERNRSLDVAKVLILVLVSLVAPVLALVLSALVLIFVLVAALLLALAD